MIGEASGEREYDSGNRREETDVEIPHPKYWNLHPSGKQNGNGYELEKKFYPELRVIL